MSHTMMRQPSGATRKRLYVSGAGVPPSVVLGSLMAGCGRTGAVVCDTPSCTERALSMLLLPGAGIST